jgi:hypothetical protein
VNFRLTRASAGCRRLKFTATSWSKLGAGLLQEAPINLFPPFIHLQFYYPILSLNTFSPSQFPAQTSPPPEKHLKLIRNLLSKLGGIHCTMEYHETGFLKDKVVLTYRDMKNSPQCIYCKEKLVTQPHESFYPTLLGPVVGFKSQLKFRIIKLYATYSSVKKKKLILAFSF